MKVLKTRENRYHTDRECMGIERANSYKEIDMETAEAWDLDACGKCVEQQEYVGKSKWSEFVRERRQV